MTGAPIDPTEGGPPCAQMSVSVTAGGFTVDARCPSNGVDARLHMTGSGDYQSSFVSDATMTMTSPGQPPMTMHNHSVWTYAGACPAG